MDVEKRTEINDFEKIKSMFDTNELNRLQRCAKNKDKDAIRKWGEDFENRISDYYYKKSKEQYLHWLDETFKDLDIAICHALHFNKKTKFGNKRLADVMDDIAENIKGFYKNQFTREDYQKQLEDDGINFVSRF